MLDVRNGVAVHAKAGTRREYRPLSTPLTGGPDPLSIANTIRSWFGLTRFYLADLDAIERTGSNLPVVAALSRDSQVRLMVDAGSAGVAAVRRVLDAGAATAVVGSETLQDVSALEEMLAAVPASRLAFSLDVKDGGVLSRCAELRGAAPAQVAARVAGTGMPTVIVLMLSRVGTGSGLDVPLLQAIRDAAPSAALLAGGGIRGIEDLAALEALGYCGALVGTALTSGSLTPEVLAWWRAGRAD